MTTSRLTSLIAASILTLWLPGQGFAAEPDPSLRTVTVNAAAGTLAAVVSPVPVLVTGSDLTTGYVRVDNNSTLIEDIEIIAIDYTIDSDGKPVPAAADYPFGSASWYAFETPAFTLPSGASRDIPFQITVPSGAGAGDHFAALRVTVSAHPGEIAPQAGTAVQTILRFESRLQHRITGADPQTPTVGLTFDGAREAAEFAARVENTGNTVIGHQADPLPTLELYSTSPWGDSSKVERTLPVKGFYVAPEAIRNVLVDWPDPPLIGQYRAVFTLPAADGQPAVTAETSLTIVNIPVVIGTAGTVILLLALLLFVLRWRHRDWLEPARRPPGRPEVRPVPS